MLPAKRKELVLERLQREGYIEIAEISETMGVSRATIRRDLNDLEQEGLLVTVHGGAVPRATSTAYEPSFQTKRVQNALEKQRIGEAAAMLVQSGQSVLLDAGSTTFQVAEHLRKKRDLTIVTNDVQILMSFAAIPGMNVICTGGTLRGPVYTLVGHQAELAIKDLHVDWTFLGADAIDIEHGITNVNLIEVPCKRAMLAAGEKAVLVTDSSKFGRISLAKVCDLTDVDLIVTDRGLPDEMRERLLELGVEVQIV